VLPGWSALPPSGVDPSRLFRRFLLPRIVTPIAHRLSFAPAHELHVRALLPEQWDEAVDGTDEPTHALVGLALCDASGHPLTTPEAVYDWSSRELAVCSRAVMAALCEVGPTYAMSNHVAWSAALMQGARRNMNRATSLATFEVAGKHPIETPERFYGVPRRLITDGQWMAYRAAVDVVLEQRGT
jgi:hypothetical protein